MYYKIYEKPIEKECDKLLVRLSYDKSEIESMNLDTKLVTLYEEGLMPIS